jgi:POT family proton-dependent oligopeptide transporter
MLWIIGSYLFQTIGELCLSPVALSFVTKMSPPRLVATMMGIYFAVTGLGDKLAGEIGKVAVTYGALKVFAGIAVFTGAVGLILMALTKSINKMAHDKEVV